MKNLLFLFVFLFACAKTEAQSRPVMPHLPFMIFDTRTGEQMTITELADRMAKTEVLFWGEEHDDAIGHTLQLKMLKLLQERHTGKLALSMEMFETDNQVLLDEYMAGFISKEKFMKEARPWNNYEDYSPIVEYAKEKNIPITAANSPRRYNSIMSSRGPKSLDSLGSSSKEFIAKLPIKADKEGRYYEKFVGIMGGEANIHSPNMFASQCLWDATMAQSIDRAHSRLSKNTLIMHLCGRFHSDEYLGTVAQLRKRNRDLNISTISCVPADDFEKPDYRRYEPLADFVILIERAATSNPID